MKVVMSTMSVSREAGGLFESVRFSSRALEEAGVSVGVVALRDKFTKEDLPRWEPLHPEIVDYVGPRQLLFAPELGRVLASLHPDVMHTHGLWQASSIAVLRHHERSGVPYVVSPRGMLDPWALANSGWKKKLAGTAFENRHLREAACLHALCDAEAEAMRAYGLRNPIAVVPNGVALPEAKQRSVQCSVFSVQPESHTQTKTLLFLGRLHPKKGLPEALRAWAEVTRGAETGWKFVIAGWDQGGHEGELKRICSELGVPLADIPVAALAENGKLNTEHSPVIFAGPAFGETKDALLRSVDAFILPSLSEGLPMSVLEAWAYGLPVLMTEECNLPEGFAAQAAIKIAAKRERSRVTSDELGGGGVPVFRSTGASEALRELMGMTDEGRATMGLRGRRLVEDRFTWPKVAAQMKEVYNWVLGQRAQPDFVRTVP
jgi:poly(glycerol-phosphate) alpha-glucosyltransferase